MFVQTQSFFFAVKQNWETCFSMSTANIYWFNKIVEYIYAHDVENFMVTALYRNFSIANAVNFQVIHIILNLAVR